MLLLASDYDGTLKQYSAEKGISTVESKDREAIAAFRKRGNLFGIVTGRSKGMIYSDLQTYGLEIDFLIAQNGSAIWNRDFKLLNVHEISPATVRELTDIMKQKNAVCFGAADLEWSKVLYDRQPPMENPEREKMQVEMATEEDFLQTRVISFFIKTESNRAAELLAEELSRVFDGRLSFHCNKDMIDVTTYGVSKETGVRWIENYYHPDGISVIGDALNDLPMIRAYKGYYITSGHAGLKPYAGRSFANIAECLTYMTEGRK